MPINPIHFRNIEQIRQELAKGSITASELCQLFMDRFVGSTAPGSVLNAVLRLESDILEQADSAESLDPGLPLAGKPVLIKDNILTAGTEPTTCGSLALQDWVPGTDAPVVQGLRKAGALILGKTNLSEWANYRSPNSSNGWSSIGGQTRNPHVLNRDPSGSSSGSAVAVSAGLCAAAIGTETDGSVCAPASFSGIVGIKPTVGLVSRTGIIPISHRQDTAGPMTRSVRDGALMLSAMAGTDSMDPATSDIPAGFDFQFAGHLGASNLEGVGIGALELPEWSYPQVEPLYKAACGILRDLRANFEEDLKPPSIGWIQQEGLALKTEFKVGLNAFFQSQTVAPPVRSLAELIDFNRRNAETVMPIFGQELLLQSQDTDPSDPSYGQALEDLDRMARDDFLLNTMDSQGLDVMVAPTANPAGVLDHIWGSRRSGNFSSPAAVTGFPHVTVPMGMVRHLPVGLSFVGRPFSEHLLLQVADCFERSAGLSLEPQFIPSFEFDSNPGS